VDEPNGLERLRGAVTRAEARLTPTERLLVQEILDNPAEAAVLSAAELARRAGVHPSNTVRLARKLGYGGFPDLREGLRGDLLGFSDAAARVRNRVAQSAEGSFLTEIIDREIDSLNGLRRHVTQESINRVAAAIAGGGHVLLFGQGHALALMNLLACRLRRSGYRNTLLSGHGVDFAEQAALLGPGDVVIAFSFFSIPPGLSDLLVCARQARAFSVLISDIVGRTVLPRPDVLLAGFRRRGGESFSLTVSMAVCNALILSLSECDGGRSLSALGRYSELCRRYLDKSHAKNPTEPDGGKMK